MSRPGELTPRIERLAEQAERIITREQLADARRQLAIERDRLEAPGRLRDDARAAHAEIVAMRESVERQQRRADRPAHLDLAELEAQNRTTR